MSSNPLDCCTSCCPTETTTSIPGLQGQAAFTNTTSSFVVPAKGANVSVFVQNTSWMAVGETIFIPGAGLFTVFSIPNLANVVLTYDNIAANGGTGNTVVGGTIVTPGGEPGVDGTAGGNAFTLIAAPGFNVPIIGATQTNIPVANSSWMTIGQEVFVQNAGYFVVVNKSDSTHFDGTYSDVDFNVFAGNNIVAGKQVSPAGPVLNTPLSIARGGTNATTVQAAITNLGLKKSPLTVYASGTAYQFTAVSSALAFGTTSPTLVINAVGTYVLFSRIRVDYNGATFAAVRTGTLKLRRTNNTAADLASGTSSFKTDVITTLTYTLADIFIPPVVYVTTNATDSISIFGDISVIPTAGSLDCVEAEIIAIRIFDQTL